MVPINQDDPNEQPLSETERLLAAFSYVGVGSLAALFWGKAPYVLRHARFGFTLHLARLLIAGFGLGIWYLLGAEQGQAATGDLQRWFLHLLGLFIVGIPFSFFSGSALPLWLTPVIVIWAIDIVGFVLAYQGSNLPWDATTTYSQTSVPMFDEEKERLSRLRDVRLARIHAATTTAATERQRENQIAICKRDLGANLVRLDHLNHLLAIGELSESRYRELSAEVTDEIASLRDELTGLGARVSPQLTHRAPHGDVSQLGSRLQARTLSLSFVDRSGLPLFTYGHFPLDEALIAGMLSAFNSLSQEVFGSSVNKTQLSEGQVLYFIHGQWSILMALFDSEPSPSQVGRLQSCQADFENANADELQRSPVQPSRLIPTTLNFDLV